MLPPITPSYPGRQFPWAQDAPRREPAKTLLSGGAPNSRALSSCQVIPDGRVVWIISQEDSAWSNLSVPFGGYDGSFFDDLGTRSNSSGEGYLLIGYAESEETFLLADDSITEMKPLITVGAHASIADQTHHDGTLFMVPGDEDHLWLVWRLGRLRDDGYTIDCDPGFPDPEDLAGSNYAGTYLYRSSDWGDTWEHYSTINERGISGVSSVRYQCVPSYPYFHDADTWWIAMQGFGPIGNPATPVAEHLVLETTDGGLTWNNHPWIGADAPPLYIVGSNTAGTGRVFARNFGHSKGVDTSNYYLTMTLAGIDSSIYNSLRAALDAPGAFFSEVDNQVPTGYPTAADFNDWATRGSMAVVWDDDGDGTAEGLWWDAEPVLDGDVNDGLHRVTAPRGFSYDSQQADSIVDVWTFDNWATQSGIVSEASLLISPGLNYYIVSAHYWVMGIEAAACPTPRQLHIPHKTWAKVANKSDRKKFYRENWETIERWVGDMNLADKCQLHIPRKDDMSVGGMRANYLALERWVKECFCCASSAKHVLHIKDKDRQEWRIERDKLTDIERWVARCIETCGS